MGEFFILKESFWLTNRHWEENFPTLVTGFTTRKVNFSPQATNKELTKSSNVLEKIVSIPSTHWIRGEQTHETNIQVVTKDLLKKEENHQFVFSSIDGLITKEKNILLTAFFADCVPIYFYDPMLEMIGIAHAGWRGTVQKMAEKMVLTFKSLGTSLEHLFVTIGPAISQNHYEVGEEIVNQVDEHLREKVVKKDKQNNYFLDLKKLNKEILLQCGVFRHNIDITKHCTYADRDLFYSYRREQNQAGRMLGFIGQT